MREILPGLFHWTARHPKLGIEVSSHWLAEGVAIDPVGAGPEDMPGPTSAVLLSNRHHYRDAGRFGCPVLASRPGLHEFAGTGRDVTGFDYGDELPGGVVAVEVGRICPDDTAFHLPRRRAMLFADAIVSGEPHGTDVRLGFVADPLMDDPEDTRRALLERFAELLAEYDFEHVLLAHGPPLVGDGRAQLQAFVDAGGRTAFSL